MRNKLLWVLIVVMYGGPTIGMGILAIVAPEFWMQVTMVIALWASGLCGGIFYSLLELERRGVLSSGESKR